MTIKAVIFDLDDTLYDGDNLTEFALRQAVQAMIDNGLNCNLEQGIERIKEIINEDPIKDKFAELARSFNQEDIDIINEGKNKYFNSDFDELKIYPDTKEVLEKLKGNYKLVLITQGAVEQQNRKIDVLGIRDYFDFVFISDIGKKREDFEQVLKILGLNEDEILVVGDRIETEIKIGNELGMSTIRLLKGKYKFLEPKSEDEKSDFEIESLNEIYNVIINLNNSENGKDDGNDLRKKLKIVAIGGGTGLPTIVEGLRKYTDDLTMIVTVTDSGRSSGMLRKELDVLPPGDIRNCLIALSNSDKLMKDLFQYRFDNGSLEGHNFGNLFIAALTKLTGSFELAVEKASRILKLKGKVLPSTFDDVNLCAELEDGKIIEEEDNIIDRHNDNVYLRSKIKKVFLRPSACANEKALTALSKADLIVLCPGSLFTSVIPNLLVDGMLEAINESKAKKVYVCNIMTQVSQTYDYKASNHVGKILDYLDGELDFVILNNENPGQDLLDSYANENAYLVENDIEEVKKLGINVIEGNFLDDVGEKKLLWEKKDLLRHNPDKIAEVLVGLVGD